MILLASFYMCVSVADTQEGATPPELNNEINYGIAYCLSQAYPGSEFASDSLYISGSYLQKVDFGIHVYEAIRDFVDAYRQKRMVSKHGRNLDIMQCLELSNSKEFRAVIEKSAN